jgi:hypothetical protein
MIVIVLICSSALSRADCDETTARAHFSFRSEFVVCGIPANFAWASTRIAPGPEEMVRVICRGR